MSDTLITITAIFLAAVLMFIVPLMTISERNDDVAQIVVESATSEFVNTVSNIGAITEQQYNELISKLDSTGNRFDIEIEVQHLDVNPGKKAGTGTGDLIGENIRYSTYTSDILDYMSDTNQQQVGSGVTNALKSYPLKKGDIIIVTVKNTNETIAQSLRTFVHKIKGDNVSQIAATASAMVANSGN